MRCALDLALKGQGRTSPNPCVGAVIVKEGKIVGEGYHKKAGTPHAEVHAINDAAENAADSTIYVTLEPCNHFGRTPPCTQAILQAGIKKVVVGMPDPNPSVEGGGCEFLKRKGIETVCGVLEEECRAINRPFIKHITSKLPWVIMKAGMSLDARISYSRGKGGRITGPRSKQYTHQLRDSVDAILVGVETALIDNPSLTTRLAEKKDTRDPLRVVLDTRLRLPPDAKLLARENRGSTVIYCGPDAPVMNEKKLLEAGAAVRRIPTGQNSELDLSALLIDLGKLPVTSVLVEGGAKIHLSMLKQKLVDEVYLFIAPFFVGPQGTPLLDDMASSREEILGRLHNAEVIRLGEDTLVHGLLSPEA